MGQIIELEIFVCGLGCAHRAVFSLLQLDLDVRPLAVVDATDHRQSAGTITNTQLEAMWPGSRLTQGIYGSVLEALES